MNSRLIQASPNRARLSTRYDLAWPFIMIALAAVLYTAHFISPLISLSLAIGLFLLGVPHGAVERVLKAGKPSGKTIIPTAGYTALYILAGIFVFGSWITSPLGTLILFLALSAWHFSKSEGRTPLLGLWVIMGSFAVFPAQTLAIFAALTNHAPLSIEFVLIAQASAYALLGAIFLYVMLIRPPLSLGGLLKLSLIIGLFFILPPVEAVACYFFARHSLGEMAETLDARSTETGRSLWQDALFLYAPASVPALAGASLIIFAVVNAVIPLSIAAGLGVAFIIPHMLPVEALLAAERETAKGAEKAAS